MIPPGVATLFRRGSTTVARMAGRPAAFLAGAVGVAAWAASGRLFGYSETWELVINTGTTIVTFLMVFLIQNSQNREAAALQAKLDELVRVSTGSNRLIGLEHLTDEEVDAIRRHCAALAAAAPTAPDRAGSDER